MLAIYIYTKGGELLNTNNRVLNIKFCNLMSSILVGLIVLIYTIPSTYTVLLFLAVLSVAILKEPVIAYFGWIIAYGFFHTITSATDIIAYLILSPILLYGVIIQIVQSKKICIPNTVIFLSTLILIAGGCSLLFSRDIINSLPGFGMLIMSIFIMISIIATIRSDPKALGIINQAYIGGCIAALISICLIDGIYGIGRLALGEHVRKLANIATPAIIILFNELILISSKKRGTILNNRFSRPTIIVLLIISTLLLLGTVSRGAYLAAAISLLVIFLSNFFWSQQHSLSKTKMIFILAATIPFIVWGINFVTDNISGNYMQRVSIDRWADNARLEIWESALIQLSGQEYFWGTGFGSFRELARMSGIDHYAHSVFIDSLISMGILGFTLIITLLIFFMVNCVKKKNSYALGLLIMTILLYLTHGNVSGSMDFWALLGIIYGACYAKYF